MLRLNLI
ncbi:hypothetical protein VCHENC02_2793, partial [Vibrio harveyi]